MRSPRRGCGRRARMLAAVRDAATHPLCKFILWAVLAGLAYHTVAGIRHLIMDFGIGESLNGGQIGARIVLVLAIVLRSITLPFE